MIYQKVLPEDSKDASFQQELLPHPNAHRSSRIGPALYLAVWFFFSTTLIFTNRYVLVEMGFAFPLTLTTWHLINATVFTRLLRRFSSMLDGVAAVEKHLTWSRWAKSVLPIGALFSLGLATGNHAYLHLSVSFIQMLKSVTPVAILLVSWIFRTEEPNRRVFLNVLFIASGVAVASYGEIQFEFVGFLLALFAIFFDAIRLVMVQKLLHSNAVKMDALTSLYYVAPVSAGFNIINALVFEMHKITYEHFAKVGIWLFIFNGLLSFCLNVAGVSVVKRTSTLVLGLGGVFKDIMIVSIATIYYLTPFSVTQIFGYTMALIGLIVYKNGKELSKFSAGTSVLKGFPKIPIFAVVAPAGVFSFLLIFRYVLALLIADCLLAGGACRPAAVPGLRQGGCTRRASRAE
ncbi:triose-phosphate transporter family-domain-containing protein [Blyttiomyces helicus]|uniref:Triose-phosphate transporter family-domain-containing protein n=1 Tax=Blyttiomyces helicus TaxID=388810 RepID=A0A4P9WGE6_9FUNG|nr:triose-phosphate transporter family-domain-containing protein [Blyttiomyces helicus]|eukprot:RKO91774.1 triose-phosphate transporter family-domain-containing protein [Blyttiomyces helicus]